MSLTTIAVITTIVLNRTTVMVGSLNCESGNMSAVKHLRLYSVMVTFVLSLSRHGYQETYSGQSSLYT